LRSLDELAASCLAGDAAAERELFDDLRARFSELAKRRLREGEWEDAVQDALRIVHDRLPGKSAWVSVLPWSLTVLRNVIGNTYQTARRRAPHEPLESATLTSGAPDPLAGLQAAELRRVIVRCIRRLEERHPRCGRIFRAILTGLAAGEDPGEVTRRGVEAASDPSVGRGNAYVVLFRCRERLRHLIEPELGR
jgi:DNA-directed RNA polymerase specialized sigma24 family protein